MRFWRPDIGYIEDEPPEDTEAVEEASSYLSDIFDCLRQIEAGQNELINQGDKQVEFLSRLVTLFEGLAKEQRNAQA